MTEPTKELMSTAYHEAGHAVAAYILRGHAIQEVSIEADEVKKTGGHVTSRPMSQWLLDAMEEADYASGYGRFIDGRVRRFVETEIMVLLAGGLAMQMMTGLDDTELGGGIVALDSEEAEGFRIKPQILNEIGGNDRVGDPIKHGEDKEG